MRVSLHFSMSHLKTRSKIALAIPPTAFVACSLRGRINVKLLLLLKISPGLTLGHPLGADLDPGLAEGLDHLESIDSEDSGRLTRVAAQKKC